MDIGDVVIHPWKEHKPKRMSLVCVIIAICQKPERGYFILANLLKNGTPSKNTRNWHYLHIAQLERCEIHTKYPHVYTCPDCQIAGYSLIESPLIPLDNEHYSNYFQCVMCKIEYALINGELKEAI